ncbi:MAG: cytochrome c3 family protein [Nitrospirota bacterium]
MAFNHDQDTKYPLVGKHRTTTCESCHTGQLYRDKTPTTCHGCHKNDDVHRRKLGTECQDCHNVRDWKIWDFDHNVRTRFKLDGGHKGLDCYACHSERMDKKVVTSSACVSCHTKDDKHEGSFGSQCDRCHETTVWKTIKPGTGTFRRR